MNENRDKKGRFTETLAINRCDECDASLAKITGFWSCYATYGHIDFCSDECWKDHAKECETCYVIRSNRFSGASEKKDSTSSAE